MKAISIATYNAKLVKFASTKEYIDIIYPLINIDGLGIIEGNRVDMPNAIKLAKEKNKGIYSMKTF